MHNAEQFINNTTSLCKICKNAINANIIANSKNEVWMIKTCSEHGDQDVRLSTNADWYTKTRLIEPLKTVPTDIKKSINYGCPFDCGPCENHEQKIRLPIVTITSSCNLNCPICYVHNKNENPYNMSIEEFKSILMHLTKNKENKLDIINLTGGEPTLHPKILDFLKLSRDTGVHRVSICSNGISLAENEPMIKQIGELNGRIALSFDSFNPQTYLRISGVDTFKVKIKCLELLKKYNIDTTLITVMNKEINDNEIGEIIKFALSMSNLRHLEIHTITYTGQGGVNINRASRISIYEVLEKIEQTTNGLLNTDDFIPAPSAHSLCYQIAYLLIDPDDGRAIPFTRFMDKQILYECLEDHLYLEPSPTLERAIQSSIDELWSQDSEESERILKILKQLLGKLFPVGKTISREEQLKISEQFAKAIYVHSHMDEETFDVERLVKCCDSNCYADGTSIPVCAYNVLYRETDNRFTISPKTWGERSGGKKFFLKSFKV